MIVTIHQPNFFPWLGFFDKIRQVDLLIFLDTVPFTKGGYQNRVQIKGSGGPQWLTVPVITSGRMGQSTLDVTIDHNLPWRKRHMATLKACYSKSPGYQKLYPLLERLYSEEYMNLADFTIPGILMVKELLGIATPVIRASRLPCKGQGSHLLAELVRAVGGDTYLSGPSGRSYLDPRDFSARGITLKYHQFTHFEYPQRFGTFVAGLSTWDYLFNDPDLTCWNTGAT